MTHAAERPAQEAAAIDLHKLAAISPHEYFIRFGFGALISFFAGAVSLVGGPRLAGLFLAFPAILPATLTLLEKKEGVAQAVSDLRGAALGAVGMIGFAFLASSLLIHGPGLALGTALVGWSLISAGLFLALRLAAARLGERQYLPEIPSLEAEPVIQDLRARGLTLGLAESCTGGTIAALLTGIPGSGDVIRGGIVAWDDEVKQRCLGVPASLIAEHGAVSPSVAREMSRGAKHALHTDVGLAITGIEGKPVAGVPRGLTYLALTTPDDRTLLRRYHHDHGPGRNRERDVRMALELVTRSLAGEPPR